MTLAYQEGLHVNAETLKDIAFDATESTTVGVAKTNPIGTVPVADTTLIGFVYPPLIEF